MSKKKVDEQEMSNLIELENSFHTTINEIISDKSLEKFRIEFEKLHEALLESHKNNNILVDKCSSLNNDIINNVGKIKSLIRMSQSDQRTIGQLRREFEKAWKIVLASSAKEKETQVIIEQLKGDIERLSQFLNSADTDMKEDATTRQEVEAYLQRVKKEVSDNKDLIANLTERIEKAKTETAQMQIEIDNNKIEMAEKSVAVNEAVKQRNDLREEGMNAIIRMKEDDNGITKLEEKVEENKKRIKDKKIDIEELEWKLKKDKEKVQEIEDDIMREKRLIERNLKFLAFHERTTEQTMRKLRAQERNYEDEVAAGVPNADNILKNLDQEKKELTEDFEKMSKYKNELSEAKLDYRKTVEENRKMLIEMHNHLNKIGLEYRRDRLSGENEERKIAVVDEKVRKEKFRKTTEEQKQERLNFEMVAEKEAINGFGKYGLEYQSEIKEYIGTSTSANRNTNATIPITEENNKQIDQLSIKLGNIRSDMKHIEVLKDTVRNDRDTKKRQIKDEKELTQVLKVEFDTVKKQTDLMKEEIIVLDTKMASEHLKKIDIQNELKVLEESIVDLNKQIEVQEKNVNEIKERVSNFDHIDKESDNVRLLSKRENEALVQEIIFLKNTVARLSSEKENAKSEIIALTNVINNSANKFDQIVEQIEDRKEECINEGNRRKMLLQRWKVCERLINEANRLDKELIYTKSMSAALAEEMAHPIAVNKWTFLEATNPEVAEMLHMKQKIVDEIRIKMHQEDKLKDKKEKVQEEVVQLNKKAASYRGCNCENEIKECSEVLKNKTKELNQMKAKFSKRNDTVTVKKTELSDVQDEFVFEHTAFLELKNRCSTARAQTANNRDRFKRGIKRPKGESVFVGGGFAYPGVPALPLIKCPISKGQRVQTERIPVRRGNKLTFLPKLKMSSENKKLNNSLSTINTLEIKQPEFTPSSVSTARKIRKRRAVCLNILK